MSLPYEYFKDQSHITDLKKLNDNELYFIIRSSYDLIEKLNDNEISQLKDLNKLYNNTKETINNIKFILNEYINIFQERADIENILYKIEKIEYQLNILKSNRIKRKNISKLVNNILLHIRLLHLLINELLLIKNN